MFAPTMAGFRPRPIQTSKGFRSCHRPAMPGAIHHRKTHAYQPDRRSGEADGDECRQHRRLGHLDRRAAGLRGPVLGAIAGWLGGRSGVVHPVFADRMIPARRPLA